jgi:hypothetical protein
VKRLRVDQARLRSDCAAAPLVQRKPGHRIVVLRRKDESQDHSGDGHKRGPRLADQNERVIETWSELDVIGYRGVSVGSSAFHHARVTFRKCRASGKLPILRHNLDVDVSGAPATAERSSRPFRRSGDVQKLIVLRRRRDARHAGADPPSRSRTHRQPSSRTEVPPYPQNRKAFRSARLEPSSPSFCAMTDSAC